LELQCFKVYTRIQLALCASPQVATEIDSISAQNNAVIESLREVTKLSLFFGFHCYPRS
jgi:hypothetical protein